MGDRSIVISLTTYILNPLPFNEDLNYDIYTSGLSASSHCFLRLTDSKEFCIGGWNKNKVQQYSDEYNKEAKKAKKRDHITKTKTSKQQTHISYSDHVKELLYAISADQTYKGSNSGAIYATLTSIFLGGQIIGILLFIGAIVLDMVFGAKCEKYHSPDNSEGKNDEE